MSEVTLLAHTVLTPEAEEILPVDAWSAENGVGIEWSQDADHLAEIAGRECYQSFSRPNPKTSANADYLANIIRQQHTSVLAHASFTFRLTDVSRSLTHELIRHRFLAVSELSQRYVDMSESRTVTPPALRDMPIASEVVRGHHDLSVYTYNTVVEDLIRNGATRKQAREAARCVLPGGTNTAMIVSGNVRAWRDFVIQRDSPGADAEIREVAEKILAVLQEYAPNSVSDLVVTDVSE